MFKQRRIHLGIRSGILLALAPIASFAEDIEVITVQAQQQQMVAESHIAIGNTINADSADWLASVPGANANKNGPVTGIAQYRGMYGDRVSVKIDGHNIIGSGPNAMDAPLSYVVPVMMESMTVYRGIAPVSAGIDTIGGAVDVQMKEADFGASGDFEVSGLVQFGYRSNNNADSLSAIANIANEDHALLAYYSSYDGNDRTSGNDTRIFPTQFDKVQFGIDYRFQHDGGKTGFSYHNVDTGDSGTPALAMDIEYIQADRFDLSGDFKHDRWNFDWSLGFLSSDHGMANFHFRPNPNPARFRRTEAAADTVDFKFHAETQMGVGTLLVGVDGYLADHDAVLTNPNNSAFRIHNFNEVKDNRIGVFAQWSQPMGRHKLTTGARIKFNQSDAGEVSHFMAGMMPAVGALVNNFNTADRSDSETNFDIAATVTHMYSANTEFHVGAAVKQRAPSYQEKYLWFPLGITGGLADGRVYVGNLELDSETSYQLNLGMNYDSDNFHFSPNFFYQRVDDYIQGTPSTNPMVVMVATMMMGDDSPLQNNNVDAEIYGADLNWRYKLSDSWLLSGVATYIKAERRDIDDNLYRIAPPNANLRLSYYSENWQGDVSLTGYAKQDDVSASNRESETAGYGLLDVSFSYFLDKITLQAGVNNMLDREYAHHLSGINRAIGSGIPPGAKIPGEGRNLFFKLQYQF